MKRRIILFAVTLILLLLSTNLHAWAGKSRYMCIHLAGCRVWAYNGTVYRYKVGTVLWGWTDKVGVFRVGRGFRALKNQWLLIPVPGI